MRNGEVFRRCLLACEAASVEAGFAPEVGRDLYLGQMSNYFLGWSHQQFGKWVFFMVELHGEKSTEGVELAELFSNICNIIVSYGKLGY